MYNELPGTAKSSAIISSLQIVIGTAAAVCLAAMRHNYWTNHDGHYYADAFYVLLASYVLLMLPNLWLLGWEYAVARKTKHHYKLVYWLGLAAVLMSALLAVMAVIAMTPVPGG